jgi:hypothetical protein
LCVCVVCGGERNGKPPRSTHSTNWLLTLFFRLGHFGSRNHRIPSPTVWNFVFLFFPFLSCDLNWEEGE